MDPEIQGVVELLFSRRLETFQKAIASPTTDDSTMEKTARLAEYGTVLQSHCARALRDYISVLELFDALAVENGVVTTFESHIDHVTAELLSASGASGQSDRNRVMNQAASVKSNAAVELEQAIDRAVQATNRTANEVDELDDRLPLGRRGAFDRDLSHGVQEAARDQTPLALVMIDVDHFKRVNDDHGHPVGDEVLLEVAKLVVNRAVSKGTAYRFGGEEFSLLLPSYSAEEAVGLAERIRKDLEAATVSSKKLSVTASFGVASVPAHASKADELLERADSALYRAKQNGRNRVATPA